MQRRQRKFVDALEIVNLLFIAISIAICTLLMVVDIPGLELLEINPNWLLIWVVSWSLKRTIWHGAIAGAVMGCIYDGITLSNPSHVMSFMLVGVFTSKLQTQKYIGEDFISVAFIVFFMTLLSEAIFAWQYAQTYGFGIAEVAQKYRQMAIVSAIITSLWSPAFYYPMNLWQKRLRFIQKKRSSRF